MTATPDRYNFRSVRERGVAAVWAGEEYELVWIPIGRRVVHRTIPG